ncbi:MAG: NAD(P)/FAD-dependent oxidoreductase, partial [Sporomusaceae bacterium]|nr:NAD(P)/FAD-dependent oxidoreductase [Sporomusaceae bacterium]
MSSEIFDIAIIGGGPAGLSAALTGRIRNKSIALFEHMNFSEKLQKAHIVDNYLGMPQVTGQGMMQQFVSHCMAQKPTVIKEKVNSIFPGDDVFTILTPGDTYEARAVIIATGVVATGLFKGEKDFLGKGVSYCPTCDGMMYKGKDVAVISYTAEGEHEADYLKELCRTVYYLPQYKEAPNMRSDIKLIHDKPKSITGDVVVENLVMAKEQLDVHGVFIIRQSDPVENVLPGLELEGDVIKVKRDMSTNIP